MDSFVQVTSKLGKSLIQKATQGREEQIAENCIGEVQTIMNRIDAAETRMESDTKLLRLLKAQMEAIEAGAFHMERPRNTTGVVIIYNDPELIEPGSMADLVNKGRG